MPKNSILDCILATDTESTNEPIFYADVDSVSKLEYVIRRDIEYLLNARCFKSFSDTENSNHSQSFLNYGLPDFTGMNPNTPSVQQYLQNEIQKKLNYLNHG
ncbi:MAG: hypothetical protein OMM_13222 [Candidatus Magnetoglobus multicellularis str. Araruama]|uniref:Uncharacterized protein n=1 Tax=Candidatus Magnetoglobus multicellularis str. Araruama TaxID=890399 RepID=A0A1V1NU61_9BACT|nr:MAG: hypothetical protein OMM_13222 [Candidatus Magnetoglobus multicellularis str. Araruama]